MPRRRSKKRDQQRHTQQRAMARTGLNISARQQEAIVQMIQRGEGTLIRKQSNRVSVFDVDYEETTLRIVYDRHRKSIATIMTPEYQ